MKRERLGCSVPRRGNKEIRTCSLCGIVVKSGGSGETRYALNRCKIYYAYLNRPVVERQRNSERGAGRIVAFDGQGAVMFFDDTLGN